MREIELEIDSKSFKEKLGIKDVDMTPIISSIASLKKDLKDIKIPKSDNKEIMSALKLLADKKTDNSDIVIAVNLLADKLSTIKSDKDYTEKFNQLMDTMTTQGRLRAGYNPYNPQIRNKEGVEINPATEETLKSIAGNIPYHNSQELGYTNGKLTSIVYKLDTEIVATKTFGYTDGKITSIIINQ